MRAPQLAPSAEAAPAILVIDDRTSDRELLAMLLRHAGYSVLETADGNEALELVRAQHPSLVISDILMPGMNGFEFVRSLRADPEIAHTQVIFCTASYDEREVGQLAAAVGVARLLPKPWQHEDMLAAVRELIGRPVSYTAAAPDFDAEHLRVMSDKLVEKVTALEQTEGDLRRSQELHRLVVENATDLISLLDPEGRLLYASPSHERILGYAPEELKGHSWAEFIHPDDLRVAQSALADAARGSTGASAAAHVRHRDGHWIAIEGVASAIYGPQGELEMLLASSRDVSERLRAEAERARLEHELHQAQKMEAVGELSGGVAHDFNNMLAAINGFAELLLRPTSELGESERRQIEQIKSAGERAASLTQQLLAFSRRQVLQPRVVSLNDVASETEAMLRRLIGEDIEFVTRLEPDLPPVYADPNQLGQVLVNLAVNARDAMPGGGQLTIATASVELGEPQPTPQVTVPPGSYVMLSVSDTGVGMDAETSARLFEPFFTTKEEGKGTGLGLSTVYGIVKQSGGFVWAESEPGRGATFKVLLPQTDVSASPVAAPEPGFSPAVSGSGTVLLVEDEEIARNVIEEMLVSAGCRVIVARDGEEALTLALDHADEIDLVMTDVVMPKMGGTELAEALGERFPALPVLYTSGYVVDGLIRHGVLAGASFIQKPFSLDALQQKLREVIAQTTR